MVSKYLTLEYVSSRSLQVTPTINDYTSTEFDDNIIELKINDEPILELGDSIPFMHNGITYTYTANMIIPTNSKSFLVQESAINSTNFYVLPFVIPDRRLVGWDGLLYNTYLNETGNRLFVVYRYGKHPEYYAIEEKLSKLDNFVKVHDHHEYVVFEMEIPEEYLDDVQHYMHGRYSKIVNRTEIFKFSPSSNLTKIRDIITKAPRRRKELEEKLSTYASPVDLSNSELASIPKKNVYYQYFKTEILTKRTRVQ